MADQEDFQSAQKKSPAKSGAFSFDSIKVLQLYNLIGCRTFGAVDNLELNPCTLIERFVTICLDSGKMNEYIVAIVLLDKTKTLGSVKPFHCAFFHLELLLRTQFP